MACLLRTTNATIAARAVKHQGEFEMRISGRISGTLSTIVVFSIIVFTATACGKNDQAAQSNDNAVENEVSSAAQSAVPHGKMDAAKQKDAIKNGFEKMPAPGTKAFCPIMQHEFEVKADTTFSEYKGKKYVFCCPGCKPTFEENPEKYIN